MRDHFIDVVKAFVGIASAVALLCFDPAHAAQDALSAALMAAAALPSSFLNKCA